MTEMTLRVGRGSEAAAWLMIFPKGLWAAADNNSSSSRWWRGGRGLGMHEAPRAKGGDGRGRGGVRQYPSRVSEGRCPSASVHSATTATTLIAAAAAAAVEFLRS